MPFPELITDDDDDDDDDLKEFVLSKCGLGCGTWWLVWGVSMDRNETVIFLHRV